MDGAAPRTRALLGVGTQHAAQLLLTIGRNAGRLRNEAAFAHLCGVSPIQASSGKTVRHRLNHGGDRQANRTLHMIIVVRLRYCPRTRAYLQRRTAEGKTKREAMRFLKRYLARALPHPHRRPERSCRKPLTSIGTSRHETPRAAVQVQCVWWEVRGEERRGRRQRVVPTVLPNRLEAGVELPDVDPVALRAVSFGRQLGEVTLEQVTLDPVHTGEIDALAGSPDPAARPGTAPSWGVLGRHGGSWGCDCYGCSATRGRPRHGPSSSPDGIEPPAHLR